MEEMVQIFKALGDEKRLKILLILSKRKMCAKGIARHLEISEAAVSQHIKVLKEAGLIVGIKTGYYVHYDLQRQLFTELIKYVEELSSDSPVYKCKSGFDLPEQCGSLCKAGKNKCCNKKSERG